MANYPIRAVRIYIDTYIPIILILVFIMSIIVINNCYIYICINIYIYALIYIYIHIHTHIHRHLPCAFFLSVPAERCSFAPSSTFRCPANQWRRQALRASRCRWGEPWILRTGAPEVSHVTRCLHFVVMIATIILMTMIIHDTDKQWLYS